MRERVKVSNHSLQDRGPQQKRAPAHAGGWILQLLKVAVHTMYFVLIKVIIMA
jgi:hypothetical protein